MANKVLLISYPKSGTHLLNQILYGLQPPNPNPVPQPFFAVYESEGIKHTEDDALAWMESIQPFEVASSHLYAWDRVVKRACMDDMLTFFLYRDPRDICVSYVFHVCEQDITHYHHDYFLSLPDFDARLMTSILDVPGGDENISNIGRRFSFYLDWLDHDEVLCVKFADLIHERPQTLKKITEHAAKRAYSYVLPEKLEISIDPSQSPTFREGRTGSWKDYFSDEHKKIFKEVAGDLLIKLGYERDYDW